MKLTFFLCLAVLCFSTQLFSRSEQQLTISFYERPQIERLKVLVENAYKEIGISVNFIETPLDRGLKELKAGRIDADLVRSGFASKGISEAFKIKLPIPPISLFLICHTNLKCDEKLITNNSVIIATHRNHLEYIQEEFPSLSIIAGIYAVKTNNSFELLDKKRVDAIIYTYAKDQLPISITSKYSVKQILSLNAYHLVHNRHIHLRDRLKNAFNESTQ